MRVKIDKVKVERAFSRAIKSYENEAYIQRDMSNLLLDKLFNATCRRTFDNVLEFGCGSGILTNLISETLDFSRLDLNDIADVNFDNLPKYNNFISGDIETCQLVDKYDLIISNAAIQWLHDIKTFFDKMSKNLNKGGILAFSTFGKDNLLELNQLENSGLDYYQTNELVELLETNYNVLATYEYITTLEFKTPVDVLKHIKATGAGATNRDVKNWTKSYLNDFSQRYIDKFAIDNGNVTLSYHPIIIVAEKRD